MKKDLTTPQTVNPLQYCVYGCDVEEYGRELQEISQIIASIRQNGYGLCSRTPIQKSWMAQQFNKTNYQCKTN